MKAGLRPALLVVAVALAVRLVYLVQFTHTPLDGLVRLDQEYYRTWAVELAAGTWDEHAPYEQGPLYAYLLSALFRLAGVADDLAVRLQLLSGVPVALLLYAVGRRVGGAGTALAAGLLAATYGPFVFHEGFLMKTFLSPLLLSALLYAAVRYGEGGRAGWLALAGALAGAATLNRESYLLLLAPLGWLALRAPGAPLRRRARDLLLLGAAAAVVLVPSAVRNWRVSGERVLVTSGGGEVFYMAHGPEASGHYAKPDFVRAYPRLEHEDFRQEARLRANAPLDRSGSSAYWTREAVRAVVADPLRAAGLSVVKLALLFGDFEAPDSENLDLTRDLVPVLRVLPSLGWLVGLAAWGAWTGRRTWFVRFALGVVAVIAAGVVLTYNFGRFRVGMVPPLVVLAALGLVDLVRCWRTPDARRRALAGTLVAVGLSAASFLPPVGGRAKWRADADALRGELASRQRFRDQLAPARARIAQGDGSSTTWRELGMAQSASGHLPEAIAAFRRASAGDPADARARALLGRTLYESGRYEAGAQEFAQALDQGTWDATMYFTMADMWESLGGLAKTDADRGDAYGRALATYAEAARRAPGQARAEVGLARVCLRLGRADEARAHAERALSLDAGYAEAARLLALARARGAATS